MEHDGLLHPNGSRWTPVYLHNSVANWLASYFEAHGHGNDDFEDVVNAEVDPSFTTRLQEMQRLLDNLPVDPQPSMLRICSTVRLTPAVMRSVNQRHPRFGVPAALLPINIIHVRSLQHPL